MGSSDDLNRLWRRVAGHYLANGAIVIHEQDTVRDGLFGRSHSGTAPTSGAGVTEVYVSQCTKLNSN